MYLPSIRFSFLTDLEKATSGAIGACRHFVGNPVILRTFWVKFPVLLTEDGGRRAEEGKLRLIKGDLRKKYGK